MEQFFNLTVKPIIISIEVFIFWFALTGLQERYFKPWAIAFWGGIEYKVLDIVFKTLDPDFIETLNNLKGSTRPELELKKLVKLNLEKAAKELNINPTERQLEDWSNKFGKLYNPYISLSKIN